jgi:hypothetical protein
MPPHVQQSVYQGMAFSRAAPGQWMTAALPAVGLQGLKRLCENLDSGSVALPPDLRKGSAFPRAAEPLPLCFHFVDRYRKG